MAVGGPGGVPQEVEEAESQNVKVALNIRPLIAQEQIEGCGECISVISGEPQVQIGPERSFTYDHVYGSLGKPLRQLFKDCVAPLVEGLFAGYNGTVLAYGQTGSGKTYTMGSGYTVGGNNTGVIPQAMKMLFEMVQSKQAETDFQVRVSYIEIHKEDVRDLLDLVSGIQPSAKGPMAPANLPGKAPITIRETSDGGIALAGVTEMDVQSVSEMAACLEQGSLCRATGSTSMNSHSSRSHAIFTITLEQRQKLGKGGEPVSSPNQSSLEDDVDHLCAKLHLVDLAGSERAKRTKADGQRLQEGIHINKGLLALGNVISALGDEKKRKEGGHVPYRDSKLTRLLQDSLGGNSRTVMIACVSPADVNMDETLNTLKYANRARNIKNKPVVNRDPSSAEVARLRQQLQLIQAELLCCQAAGGGDSQAPRQHANQLEAENAKLRCDIRVAQLAAKAAEAQVLDAQKERDRARLQLETVRSGGTLEDAEQSMTVVEGHLATIRHLEAQLQDVRLRQGSRPTSAAPSRTFSVPVSFVTDSPGCLATPPNGISGDVGSPMPGETIDECTAREEEAEALAEAKGWEHRLAQERMDQELQDLNKKLEEKEELMNLAAFGDQKMLHLKAHYERVLKELEEERQRLQGDRDRLLSSLNSVAGKNDTENSKLKENYRNKIKSLEEQLSDLKAKQVAQAQLLRMKQRSDEAGKRLQEEIQRIKSQKVQLQRKMKLESDQFHSWKVSHEKELGQLRKAGRRNEYEMHKLQALHQRQQKVLQRKTEEAAVATKRLKEVLAARKPLPKETQPQTAGGTLAGKSSEQVERQLKAWLEREIEVYVRVQDVRNALQREVSRRKEIAQQLAALREGEQPLSSSVSFSPRKAAAKMASMQAEVAARSASIAELQAQLLSVEESQKGLSNPAHRWLHVRSMPEARTLLNIMFAAATDARCQVQSLNSDLECMHEQAGQYESDLRSVRQELRQRQAKAAATNRAMKEALEDGTGDGLAKGWQKIQRSFQTLEPQLRQSPKSRLGSQSPLSSTPSNLEEKAVLKPEGGNFPNPEESLRATASGSLLKEPRGESDGVEWVSDMETDGGSGQEYEDPNDKEYVPGLSPAVHVGRRRRGSSRSNASDGSSAELQVASLDAPSEAPSKKQSKGRKRPVSGKRRALSETGVPQNEAPSAADGPPDEASGESCQCTGMCKRKCACRAAGGQCGAHCGCSSARCANRHEAEEGNVDPAAHVAAITMDLAEAMEAVELEAALLLGITDSEPSKSTEPTANQTSLKPEKPEQKVQASSQETEEGSSTDGNPTSERMEGARALLARHGAKLTQAWLEGASQTEEAIKKRQPLGSIDRNSMTQAARLGAAKQKRRLYRLAELDPSSEPQSEATQTTAPQAQSTTEFQPPTAPEQPDAQNPTPVDPPSLARPRAASTATAHVSVSQQLRRRPASAPPLDAIRAQDGPQSIDAPLGESSPNLAPQNLINQAAGGSAQVPGDRRKRSGSFGGLQQVAALLGPQSETPTGRRISGSLVHTVSPAQQIGNQPEATARNPNPPKEEGKSPSKGSKAKWASKRTEGGAQRWENLGDKENQRF